MLEYDKIAAHALLCAIRDNSRALQMASKLIERRRGQTVSFMAQLPSLIYKTPVTRLSGEFRGSATGPKSIAEDDEQRVGLLMNRIFYEKHGKDNESVIEGLVRTRTGPDMNNRLISITQESSFDDIAPRVCNEMRTDTDVSDELASLEIAKTCAASYFHLGKLVIIIHQILPSFGDLFLHIHPTNCFQTRALLKMHFVISYKILPQPMAMH